MIRSNVCAVSLNSYWTQLKVFHTFNNMAACLNPGVENIINGNTDINIAYIPVNLSSLFYIVLIVPGKLNCYVSTSTADLSPMTEYRFRVFALNSLGTSESYAEFTVSTPKLDIPVSKLMFDVSTTQLHVVVNTTQYCTVIQVGTIP